MKPIALAAALCAGILFAWMLYLTPETREEQDAQSQSKFYLQSESMDLAINHLSDYNTSHEQMEFYDNQLATARRSRETRRQIALVGGLLCGVICLTDLLRRKPRTP